MFFGKLLIEWREILSDYVVITKNGIKEYECGREMDTVVESETNIFKLLRVACRIEEGVTLLDIFNAVDQHQALKEFIGEYSWCSAINDFHEEARKELAAEDLVDRTPLKCINVSRYIEVSKYGVEIIDDLSALGPPDEYTRKSYERSNKEAPQEINYSIGFSPTNTIAHLPVTLSSTVRCMGEDKDLFVAEGSFSLLEVLDAIYWDISFYGGPAEIRETADKLHKECEEIYMEASKC